MDLTFPAPSAQPRIDWRRAWRALRALREQTDNIEPAFEVMIALDGGQMERLFQRFLGEPDAPLLLAERPSLLAALADSEALRRLPEGSLGRAYLSWVESTHDVADGLRKAGQVAGGLEELLPGRARQWFIERNGCVRDLLHVLTGYGQDRAGKMALLAFDCGLAALRAHVIGLLGAVMTAPWWPLFRVHRFACRAWLRGKRACIPLSYRWEEALARPLEHIRYEIGIEPAWVAHPRGILAGGQQHGSWRYAAPPN